jgi:hypothetical protein
MSTGNPLFVLTILQSVQNSAMRTPQTWPDPFSCEEEPTLDTGDQWAHPSRTFAMDEHKALGLTLALALAVVSGWSGA